MLNCYRLFGALASGWRQPPACFVIRQEGPIDFRVMPHKVLKRMSNRRQHDSLKERIKHLQRKEKWDERDQIIFLSCQMEYENRLAGEPDPDFVIPAP